MAGFPRCRGKCLPVHFVHPGYPIEDQCFGTCLQIHPKFWYVGVTIPETNQNTSPKIGRLTPLKGNDKKSSSQGNIFHGLCGWLLLLGSVVIIRCTQTVKKPGYNPHITLVYRWLITSPLNHQTSQEQTGIKPVYLHKKGYNHNLLGPPFFPHLQLLRGPSCSQQKNHTKFSSKNCQTEPPRACHHCGRYTNSPTLAPLSSP